MADNDTSTSSTGSIKVTGWKRTWVKWRNKTEAALAADGIDLQSATKKVIIQGIATMIYNGIKARL